MRWVIDLVLIKTALGVKNENTFIFIPGYSHFLSKKHFKFIDLVKKLLRNDERLVDAIGGIPLALPHKKVVPERIKFTDKEQLISYEIDNILVGDLIYDTYLKNLRKPTVDMEDPYLSYLIGEAKELIKRYNHIISECKPDAIFISHAVYLVFGILTRVALSRGKRVFVFGNSRGRQVLKLKHNHPFQTPEYDRYPDYYNAMNDKTQLRQSAIRQLESRFKGNIDNATQYMRKSAYSDTSEIYDLEEFGGTKCILIMAHSFLDSPHLYGRLLFPDFWTWIEETINIAKERGYQIFIKPHPNGLMGEDEIVDSLYSRFPFITIIDKQTPNNALINAQFDLCVTVYGTVAHEFSYNGTPVLCAGDNPHKCYSFAHTSQTTNDYKKYLSDPSSWTLPPNHKSQIVDFLTVEYFNDFDGRNWYWQKTLGSLPKNCEPKQVEEIFKKFEISKLLKETRKNILSLWDK